MADFASLQFEMERRSILFTANTTMPDNSLLGFEGNPNSIVSPSTAGQTLIYNSPRGTNYLQLSNGTLWFKNASPNTWIAVADAQLSGYVDNTFATIINLASTGQNLQNQVNNLYNSGFITGIDLSSYATNSNLQLTGQNLQNQIDNLDLNYASESQLSQTGSALQSQINILSGYLGPDNILEYTAQLSSGYESLFLTYPITLATPPSSVICSFQNTVDDVIYNYVIGQVTSTGFYVNFSDFLTNSGYLLNIKIKK